MRENCLVMEPSQESRRGLRSLRRMAVAAARGWALAAARRPPAPSSRHHRRHEIEDEEINSISESIYKRFEGQP